MPMPRNAPPRVRSETTRIGSSGWRDPRLDDHERDQGEMTPKMIGPSVVAAAPAAGLGVAQPVDDADEAGRRGDGAGDVELGTLGRRLVAGDQGERADHGDRGHDAG